MGLNSTRVSGFRVAAGSIPPLNCCSCSTVLCLCPYCRCSCSLLLLLVAGTHQPSSPPTTPAVVTVTAVVAAQSLFFFFPFFSSCPDAAASAVPGPAIYHLDGRRPSPPTARPRSPALTRLAGLGFGHGGGKRGRQSTEKRRGGIGSRGFGVWEPRKEPPLFVNLILLFF